MYQPGKEYQIYVDLVLYRYYIHKDHRNGNMRKSQWTCSPKDEISLFKRGVKEKWFENNESILFSLVKEGIEVGKSLSGNRLFFSKFVYNSINWHGYPADYIKNSQDKPSKSILCDWFSKKLIGKRCLRQIMKGQPCL